MPTLKSCPKLNLLPRQAAASPSALRAPADISLGRVMRPARPLSLAGLRDTRGSSLLETALVMPVLVLMLCFAVDIGYFFIVAANLVSSSRNAVLYSAQGFASAGQQRLPSPGIAGT